MKANQTKLNSFMSPICNNKVNIFKQCSYNVTYGREQVLHSVSTVLWEVDKHQCYLILSYFPPNYDKK